MAEEFETEAGIVLISFPRSFFIRDPFPYGQSGNEHLGYLSELRRGTKAGIEMT
jgi:hypothetical protein